MAYSPQAAGKAEKGGHRLQGHEVAVGSNLARRNCQLKAVSSEVEADLFLAPSLSLAIRPLSPTR